MNKDTDYLLKMGERLTTIKEIDNRLTADVYLHESEPHLLVVELCGKEEDLLTVVHRDGFKKELDKIFFKPIGYDKRNEHEVFEEIRKYRPAEYITGYEIK